LRRAQAWMAALVVGCAALAAAGPVTAAAGSGAPAMPFAGPALDSEQIAIAYVPGGLRLFDVLQVANPQSQTLRQIQLPLAAGARDVQVQSGGDPAAARVQGDTLILPLQLPPQGHAVVAFSYTVPARGLPVNVVRTVAFPTAQLAVVMRADQLTLRTGSLAAMGTTRINGLTVRQFGAAAIPPGTLLAFTAAPAPGWLADAAAAFTPAVWLAVASVALAGLLVIGLRRDAAPTARPAGEP
jgi:hypothetical protein